jgi:hypothetical protein
LASPPCAASAIRLIGPTTEGLKVMLSLPEPPGHPLDGVALSVSATRIASRSEQLDGVLDASSAEVVTWSVLADASDANPSDAMAAVNAAASVLLLRI